MKLKIIKWIHLKKILTILKINGKNNIYLYKILIRKQLNSINQLIKIKIKKKPRLKKIFKDLTILLKIYSLKVKTLFNNKYNKKYLKIYNKKNKRSLKNAWIVMIKNSV